MFTVFRAGFRRYKKIDRLIDSVANLSPMAAQFIRQASLRGEVPVVSFVLPRLDGIQ